jgi:sialidase-1
MNSVESNNKKITFMMNQVRKNHRLIFVFCIFLNLPIFAQQHLLPYSNYFQLREGISNTYSQIKKGTTTVAFLGGSITYGPGWRDSVCQYLQKRFPKTKFHFINAGIPSLGSLPAAFRFQRDVLDSGKIDLLFIEAAVNDCVNETDSITQVRSLEGIVRHARKKNPKIDIILMSFAGPEKLKDYGEGRIPTAVGNHELVAKHYHLPSINLAKEVYDKIKAGEFSWEKDFKDVHPSPFGHKIYFHTINELLGKCFDKAKIRSAKEISYTLPPPLNRWSFENGKYFPIQKVHLQKGWKLVENWQPKDKVQTREGFVNRPILEATMPGASLSLTFKGTAIGIAIVAGPDAGEIGYSIDGKIYHIVDLYTQWSSQIYLPWYVLFAGNLENKNHVLQLRISKDKNPKSEGTACRIVYFLLNN